ncbi:MAG: ADP,ATP carrier protein 1 [Candidatus Anoxychlamydiales bacterium]|nr:ADP,ATP carrier protein 1 [Candidatus Anoxychlamydiales bacterium]
MLLKNLRSFFWPIQKVELKKVIPMFLMCFFFVFNYTILKDINEPLIVTARGSGAETIAFLKLWGTLPLALLFMFVYSKLSRKLSKKTLFYSIIGFFISFYLLFGFVLYPLKDVLHPHAFADKLEALLPRGFSGGVALIRNWTFSLFYALSELWGTVGVSFLFWGFSNDTTKISESKRFYSLFGIGAAIAMMVAGPTNIYFSNVGKLAIVDSWGVTLKYLMSILFISGLSIMGVYYWINRYVLTDKRFKIDEKNNIKNEKEKTSVIEALKFILKSRYLLLIAGIVMGYSISVSFADIVWKNQLKQQFPHPCDYSAFIGYFSSIVSILTLIMLFVGGGVIRKFGWKKAALVTPLVFLLAAIGSFGFIIFKDQLNGFVGFFGTSTLVMAIVFGAIQNALAKCFKFSFYEPTKEMAYIPLDNISRTKGKAAIDILVIKFSKAGGAFLLQALIIIFGSLAVIVPYIALILFGVIAVWTLSVVFLNKRFLKLTNQDEQKEIIIKSKNVAFQTRKIEDKMVAKKSYFAAKKVLLKKALLKKIRKKRKVSIN